MLKSYTDYFEFELENVTIDLPRINNNAKWYGKFQQQSWNFGRRKRSLI